MLHAFERSACFRFRSAGRERRASSWATGSLNLNRARQLLGQYRFAGEELYNQAFRGKMPEESFPAKEEYVQEMPCVTWNMMDTTMRSADPAMPIYDAFGYGVMPYFTNVPEAAPPSPSATSLDVDMIMNSMRLLQAMAPEQAAKILQDTAALSGGTCAASACTNVSLSAPTAGA
ncbi:vwkA [Symbiodinium sp. CCMP2592]|nr:vwkA [Symbiodinium sp. CCMP2592]